MISNVNLADKFSLFVDHWHPRVVGELNESYVKLAKLKGEFVWHQHADEDEMFLVIKGTLLIRLRDQEIRVSEGEFVVIPKGVSTIPSQRKRSMCYCLNPNPHFTQGMLLRIKRLRQSTGSRKVLL